MIKLKKHTIETAFNKNVIDNICCLGVDTASRTGWAFVKTAGDIIVIDYGFVEIKSKNELYKFNELIVYFKSLIGEGLDAVVVEDTFCGFNKKGFKFLSRIGMIIYTLSFLAKVKHISFLLATSARKRLGIKGNIKKTLVHEALKEKLPMIKVTDEDIVDAIILALNGVLEDVHL